MRENKPNLEGKIANQNVKELLEKLLHRDPAERPTAKEVLDYPWLASVVKEKDSINTDQDSDKPVGSHNIRHISGSSMVGPSSRGSSERLTAALGKLEQTLTENSPPSDI